MHERDVRACWEKNAEAWTELSRAGYDVARDLYNTPTFLDILPKVDGMRGLDIGCGEGHNTRLVAARGASMWAIDPAKSFVGYAEAAEREASAGIRYGVASALSLPFADESFDFCTAFMSIQDMPEQERAFAEAYRVLRPGGFLQFSITHPCFQTPQFGWVTDDDGKRIAVTVGDYFEARDRVEEWTFGAAPEEVSGRFDRFRVPYFDHTLTEWMHMLLDAGFMLEAFAEPHPSRETVAKHPGQRSGRIIAYFLIVRVRKGSASRVSVGSPPTRGG